MPLAQRENCAVPNKKLFGPMVRHMSLSKPLVPSEINNRNDKMTCSCILYTHVDICNHYVGDEMDSDLRYETENEHWFNRTFHPNEYFYCDTCKEFSFTNDSRACVNDGKDCSYVTMDNSRIYLGDYEDDNPKSKSLSVCGYSQSYRTLSDKSSEYLLNRN